MGFDPAIKNFGFCAIRVFKYKAKFKVLNCGNVRPTLLEFSPTLAVEFRTQIEGILQYIKPDRVVIERFVNRGMMAQAMNEKVNIMIGLLICLCTQKNIQFDLVSAPAWKNKVNRGQPKRLTSIHNTTRALVRKKIKEKRLKIDSKMVQNQVAHSVDSCLLCLVFNTNKFSDDKATVGKVRLERTINNNIPEKIARKLLKNAMPNK